MGNKLYSWWFFKFLLKKVLFLNYHFVNSIEACGNGYLRNIVTTSLFMTLLQLHINFSSQNFSIEHFFTQMFEKTIDLAPDFLHCVENFISVGKNSCIVELDDEWNIHEFRLLLMYQKKFFWALNNQNSWLVWVLNSIQPPQSCTTTINWAIERVRI